MNRISLSFSSTRWTSGGGCAPNIAYTLALLSRPLLMATAGEDFGEYRQWLDAAGIDTTHVKQIGSNFCASFFCSTDVDNNQIASFYTGAMADAGQLSFREVKDCGLAIIAPNDRARWSNTPKNAARSASRSSSRSRPAVRACRATSCATASPARRSSSRQRPSWSCGRRDRSQRAGYPRGREDADCDARRARVVGADDRRANARRPAGPHVDPTGVSDAYRGGLMRGISLGLPYEVCARPDVAATYALEHLGG
jgi:adenosine kinase